LIVVERETCLRTFIQSGVSLDARLSSDLLTSVFQRTSPLHDGAVIIQGEKVAAAACFLPLTTNPGLISSLGTRHRAAIGITEESDSLAIVISETDGRISIAAAGTIELGVTIDRLRMKLIQYFGPVVAPPRGVNAAGILVDRPEENLTLDGSAAAAASERQRSRTAG
jgi:diadenylate cyclase